MKVRVFQGSSLPSAINKVKLQLGEDAVILHTRKRRKGGLMGLFGREIVEVTAAPGENKERQGRTALSPGVTQRPPGLSGPDSSWTRLEGEVQELKDMVAALQGPETVSEGMAPDTEIFRAYTLLSTFNRLLVENDVTPENAGRLLREVIGQLEDQDLQHFPTVRNALLRAIARGLGEARDLSPGHQGQRAIAIVGPTGVGKTTTVAKLAARYALLERYDVAVITSDTYRIAAVEQLRRYAEIINVPLEVVMTPGELSQAMERQRQKQMLLIDTAGRSQRNTEQIAEVADLLRGARQVETVLALSLTTKYRDLLDMVDKYSRVSWDALLLTKKDESNSFGNIYNLATRYGKPFTFITTGQNVPDDIEEAEPKKMADWVMGEGI